MDQLIVDLYNEWKDQYGLIDSGKGETNDNGIVFTAEFIILCHLLGYKFPKDKVIEILKQFYDENGIKQRPDKISKEDYASLDNVTAIYSLSYLYDLHYHKEINPFYTRCFHFRDIFYFIALKYRFLRYPMMLLCGLFMIITCFKLFEIKPSNFYMWITRKNILEEKVDIHYFNTWYNSYKEKIITTRTYKSGETLTQYKYIGTSTKLLCFIRFNTLSFGFIQTICEKLLKRNFRNFHWYEIMHIYFRNPNHPNTRLAHEIYTRGIGTDKVIQ